jgi:hypothetical protein
MNKKKESFMLKKIMKAALAASLVFGMSSFAYAADGKIGGSFKEYFGQYNSGASGYSAHFANFGEANLQFTGTAGNVSVFYEIESKPMTNTTGAARDLTEVQRKVSYKSPIGLVSIGNIVNIGTIPMAASGFKTSDVPYSTRRALVWAGYKEDDGIDITIPLEGLGFVQATMYSSAGTAASATAAGGYAVAAGSAAAAVAAGLIPADTTDGTTMSLGANLNFGGIGVRVGYTTDKTDDPSSSADQAMESTSLLLGAKVPLGENMAIAFDYASAKVKYSAWSADAEATALDATFEMKGVGPGKLMVGIDMVTAKDTYKRAVTSVVYDIAATKTSGFQIGYIANNYTPDGGSSTTESFMGGGVYASF